LLFARSSQNDSGLFYRFTLHTTQNIGAQIQKRCSCSNKIVQIIRSRIESDDFFETLLTSKKTPYILTAWTGIYLKIRHD